VTEDSEEADAWITKANALLREHYRSVCTKQEVTSTAKLSVFKLVFVPILIYGLESWVMTKIILSQGQAVQMGFLKSRPWCDTSRQSAQL